MNEATKKEIIELLKENKELPYEYEEELFPDTKKEYELKYSGKEKEEKIINDTYSVPFQPVKHFGKTKENEWNNMLIFGDNLQILKHLQNLKKEGRLKNPDGSNGVKLVYIDPPFGTGDAYDANNGASAYSAKLQGVKYLEFVRKRLVLLKELLTDDGSIYVRLDYHFGHYIKILLDEIFGKENFQNEFIVKRGKVQFGSQNKYTVATDSVYCYTKSISFKFNKFKRERYENEPKSTNMILRGDRNPRERTFVDSSGKKRILIPPSGTHFKFVQPKVNEMTEKGLILLKSSRKGIESGFMELINGNWVKTDLTPSYTFDMPKAVDTNWTDISGYSQNWDYPTENSELLLERVVTTSSDSGDIVLDCFAGSGTTGAVAEKLGRKWILADCGKLSMYTIQKRLLNLNVDIGNSGKSVKCSPFVVYNAGLYSDDEIVNKMQGEEYKDFVLELFGCQKRKHLINGLNCDGTLNNASVMIFDKMHYLTHEFVDDLHKNIGSSIKDRVYLIAPVGVVGFNEDYVSKGNVKYYVLRIPNSIIEYIRAKNFTKLDQPRTVNDVNQTIDAIGFDFVYPPEIDVDYFCRKPKEKIIDKEFVVKINSFEPIQLGSKIIEFKDPKSEALAMVLIDTNYDEEAFTLDKVFFGDEIVKNKFEICFSGTVGKKIMLIYIDVFGNEKKELLDVSDFKQK